MSIKMGAFFEVLAIDCKDKTKTEIFKWII